ncbi:ABC transporter substrate-binding protein [Falsigemmobacter faecalis]|uniref:ABC transporter substrate-binding protein n=1 Tax=Falsigemmobacter faecalis TaxID=2488730 RepID=A0A3P3D5G6_9RHOB|nr:ABC transporter substrate-binding protein [Falsigemmobacter faecalis]RRH68836.1 ABC transporter substrate-binding protein [Falsigemmobacter faecalis]
MTLLPKTLAALLLSAGLVQAGGPSLVLAIGGEPETGFDPVMGWGSYGNPLFQSTLLKRDTDLATTPDLATDWRLSEDRLTWTITIRDDVKFSDGSALTAQDVAFTFTTAKAAAGERDLQVMKGAEAIDAHSLRITLTKPWITFAETFYTLGIVPAASYGPGYGRNPLGSGPFRLVSWAEGEQMIVEPNPVYYGAAPPFGKLTFLFTGQDAGLAAAQAGVAHLVSVPAQLAEALPPKFRAVRARTVDNRGLSLPFGLPAERQGRQTGHAVTADPAIRRAINLGIDRSLVVDVALHGHGTPAFGSVDGLPWSDPQDRVAYDPEGALAVLDAGGWRPGADGIRVKDGLRAGFRIHYPAADATRQALAETAAELLRPLGIEATPVGGSWEAIGRVMHSEPVVFGFGSHSPWQLYSIFSSDLGGVGWANPTYYANPKVDALFARAQSAESLEASYPLWAAAAAEFGLQKDNAWAWLVNLDHVYFVSDCLEIGPTQTEPHGHGWPVTATLAQWRWSCE